MQETRHKPSFEVWHNRGVRPSSETATRTNLLDQFNLTPVETYDEPPIRKKVDAQKAVDPRTWGQRVSQHWQFFFCRAQRGHGIDVDERCVFDAASRRHFNSFVCQCQVVP
jgi:hypothetical protein